MKTVINLISIILAGIIWNLELGTYNCFAQRPTPTKLNFSLAKKLYDVFQLPSTNSQLKKADEEIAVLVKGDTTEIRKQMQLLGGTFRYAAGNIVSIQIPLSKVNDLANNHLVQRIEYNDFPPQPLNDQMVINTNAALVHAGIAPLPQGYDGTGVIIGIVDNGIDYTHPDFRDVNGKTRIKYLWDMSSGIGKTPNHFHYGQEWNSAQIDSGLPTIQGDHGTLSASIAAGNGLAVNNYKGAAPGADLIIVSIGQSSGSNVFVDATAYIYEKALEMGKPAVVNISYTSGYLGSHDGKNYEAEAIDNLITQRNGRVLVAAAGNNGAVPFHLSYNVTQDTSFTWLLYNSRWGGTWCQIWMDTISAKNIEFAIGADKVSPDYSYRGRIPFLKAINSLGIIRTDTLFNNGKRIGIIQSYTEFVNNSYAMEFSIRPDSTQYNWRLITTGSGKFDAWTIEEKLTSHFAYKNLPDSTKFPDMIHYKLPDNYQTITNSFQCSPYVITVGNYMNRNYYSDVNGTIQGDTVVKMGDIHPSSSRGPTRDGRIKPEIAAGGANTLACLVLSQRASLITNYPTYIGFGGMHRIAEGTSAAAPVVAGVVALYLQQNPDASNEEVRNAVMNCAKADSFTGKLPNPIFGYGKIDAFKMLTQCSGLVGIEDANKKEDITLMNYPNPFSEHTTIFYDLHKPLDKSSNAEIKIYDILGKTIQTIHLHENSNSITFTTQGLQQGIYFYSISVDKQVLKTQKLVIM